MKTVVGLYSSLAEANKVKSALQAEGYEASHINVIDQTGEGYTGTTQRQHRARRAFHGKDQELLYRIYRARRRARPLC